jgi:4-hydroxybenzoate polyprenyltransferase
VRRSRDSDFFTSPPTKCTVHLLAGAAATRTPISPWLAAFSTFLFLSLVMVKRFSELRNLSARGINPSNGRGYLLSDLEQLRSFVTSSAYASVVVLALYISGNGVVELYRHAQRLWLTTPMMILWLSRVWLLASRGLLDEDPVVFALTDRTSLRLGWGPCSLPSRLSRGIRLYTSGS